MITLKNIAEATNQEIFNQVVEHAFQMKEQCGERDRNGDFACKYRHGSNKCFAGALIADDEYYPDFESMLWGQLPIFEEGGELENSHLKLFVQDLQYIHDFYNDSEDGDMHKYFDKEFREFALNNELKYTSRF